jgi:hypothetical protein
MLLRCGFFLDLNLGGRAVDDRLRRRCIDHRTYRLGCRNCLRLRFTRAPFAGFAGLARLNFPGLNFARRNVAQFGLGLARILGGLNGQTRRPRLLLARLLIPHRLFARLLVAGLRVPRLLFARLMFARLIVPLAFAGLLFAALMFALLALLHRLLAGLHGLGLHHIGLRAVVIVLVAFEVLPLALFAAVVALEALLEHRLSRRDDAVVVFGMLEVVFRHNPVAGARRVARKRHVLFGDVLGGTADFDIGA